MKRLVFDLDGTLTHEDVNTDYAARRPNIEMVRRLREYKAQGFEIIIASARNMRTHGNSVGRINALTLPVIIRWLEQHDIPFDEIHVGKPWCGNDGFYIDDKAIRPSEFRALDYDAIMALLNQEANAC